ncbi:MAG TPA: hypothetical protein VGL86_18000 [Polyangia bacterium]|jgi:hypothetical protein
MNRLVVLFLASTVTAAAGCATAPIAFSVSTNAGLGTVAADPEVWSRGSALQLHYEFLNTTAQKMSVCLCAAAVHVESITRDGQRVDPVLLDVNVVDDPRAFFAQQIRELAGEQELALQTDGIAEGRVDHDQWQLYGYKLMRGRYRVVFSYQYVGPDYDKPNVFHGRVTARPIYFTVE